MKTYIENTKTISETYKEGRFFIVKYWDKKLQRDDEKSFESESDVNEFIKNL